APCPASDELLRVEPASVVCTAVYPENGRIIARLYESEGRATAGRIVAAFALAGARETNALLEGGRELESDSGKVVVSFRPFEIKTIALTPKT
ncbi:MAG TPA: glycosyl hydrolase-related protein, partial [Candidatus Brocadiia bacterium]|nr:glycosyl hydrolase-related protein [Candidatus Brocadiia bacterium]